MRNPYNVLGITTMDSYDTIKAKYRQLCKKYHPDLGGDAEKFKEVVEAWEQLKDISPQSGTGYYWSHSSLFTIKKVSI